jgi:hypothetical protein
MEASECRRGISDDGLLRRQQIRPARGRIWQPVAPAKPFPGPRGKKRTLLVADSRVARETARRRGSIILLFAATWRPCPAAAARFAMRPRASSRHDRGQPGARPNATGLLGTDGSTGGAARFSLARAPVFVFLPMLDAMP